MSREPSMYTHRDELLAAAWITRTADDQRPPASTTAAGLSTAATTAGEQRSPTNKRATERVMSLHGRLQ